MSRFRAYLLLSRSLFDEADRLFDQTITLYRECGEVALTAQTLSDRGVGVHYAGDLEKAIPLFQEALELVDEQSNSRLEAMVRHGLAHCLSDLGRHQEALRLLEQARTVYRELGDRITLLRARWLEGKILHGLERTELAEEAFVEVRDAFIQEEIAYDAALVSLDLAALYAAQGRTSETRRLAEQMIPIFESRDVHREALAALVVFREAAQAEQATLALVQEIGAYLRQARFKPDLRFRPSL